MSSPKARKSSLSVNKHTPKGSIISIRERSLTERGREGKSSVQTIEENFTMTFQRYCIQFKTWIVPEVIIIPQEPLPGVFLEFSTFDSQDKLKNVEHGNSKNMNVPKVLAIFDNYEIQNTLISLILKNFLVDRSMLIALRKSFQKFATISTLKLEFCSLKNTDLRTLKTVLQKNESVKDLSINGNPNKFQNFYILFKETKLTNISMRFCQITDRGVELIASQLSNFSEQTLLSLNLSSNFISDTGMISIANFLRLNRKLISLNLADNWITDTGCATLTNVLKKFPLTHEEVVERRHRIINFLRKKAQMLEMQTARLLQGLDSESVLSVSKKTSRDSAGYRRDSLLKKNSRGHNSLARKDLVLNYSKNPNNLDMKLVEEMVEEEIGVDEHPHVKDSYPDNNEIYCRGNFDLIHLNLSFNKITTSGLEYIIDMLQYQKLYVVYPQEGLTYIALEGILVPEFCMEIDNINELLRESYSKRFVGGSFEGRRNSKRKKSAPSRVSIQLNLL